MVSFVWAVVVVVCIGVGWGEGEVFKSESKDFGPLRANHFLHEQTKFWSGFDVLGRDIKVANLCKNHGKPWSNHSTGDLHMSVLLTVRSCTIVYCSNMYVYSMNKIYFKLTIQQKVLGRTFD